jgi:hypothetical protein
MHCVAMYVNKIILSLRSDYLDFHIQNLTCREPPFVGHIELLPERDRKLQTIPK